MNKLENNINKNRIQRFIDKPFLSWAVVSSVMYLIIELINQRSFIDTIKFIFTTPHIFLVNILIVALTYSFVLFFRRRLFIYTLVTFLWTVVGVINMILLIQRNTQFNASDIIVFQYGLSITLRYFNAVYIVLTLLAIFLCIFGIVVLFRRGYKSDITLSFKTSAAAVGSAALICAVLIFLGNITGFLNSRFTDINAGYKHNGFVYSYACSLFTQGVEEPYDYDEEAAAKLFENLDMPISDTDNRPNVIFVQLESFIDPMEIEGLEYESSPVPNFERLQEEYPSGYLTVPVVGGGTANTEFEVLTGMNLKHFGTIELPYESILIDNTCESMAYNYKALGYKAHAIHDYSAGFYKRNTVYSNLGFDTFTSFEYMTDIEYNPIGWAKDTVLERYIMASLESTDESDFVFAVSVQGHGSYPNDFDDSQSDLSSTYFPEDIGDYRSALSYYVTQVNEMDQLIGSLTDTLSDYGEDTVVVFYGDHLPGIDINPELLARRNIYETEYLIWANFDLGDVSDRDLCTYQISSYVQEILGFHSGKITQLHQKYIDTEEYEKNLQILEYDIIEKDAAVYNGISFEPTELKLGIEDIVVTGYDYDAERNLTVYGENFNEHSAIYINGTRKSTVYVDKNTLKVEKVKLKNDYEVSVGQVNYQLPWSYLSMSNSITVSEINED